MRHRRALFVCRLPVLIGSTVDKFNLKTSRKGFRIKKRSRSYFYPVSGLKCIDSYTYKNLPFLSSSANTGYLMRLDGQTDSCTVCTPTERQTNGWFIGQMRSFNDGELIHFCFIRTPFFWLSLVLIFLLINA